MRRLYKRRIVGLAGLFFLGSAVLIVPAWGAQESAASPDGSTGATKKVPIEVAGDRLDYLESEKKIIGEGNVIVTYQELTLTCDRVEVFTETKQAFAEGHVVLYRGEDSFRGDKVFYDFAKDQGSFPDGRTIDIPWYSHGERIEQVSSERIEIYNGSVTNCDLDHPHYELTAKRLTVLLGDKMIARNVIFRVLGKPVFWWPYYIISLENHQPPVEIAAGQSKKFGYYILVSKGFAVNEYVSGKWHADYRTKRGFMAGADFKYDFTKSSDRWGKRIGRGDLKLYYGHDKESPNWHYANPFDQKNVHDVDRGRAMWRHYAEIDRYTSLRINWAELSDEHFLKDFFEREHRQEISPESFINVTRNTKNYGLVVEVEKRSNRFEGKLERLPEIRFDWKTTELLNTGIYYQNAEEFSVLNRKASRSPEDTDVVRFDTFHRVNYPRRFFRFDFNPYGDWEGTYWSKKTSGEANITRQVWGGGLDISTRFYRIYNAKGSFLKIRADKIRHLIEPSVRYEAKRKVDRKTGSIFQLDSIDSREVTDILKYGIENRIQTKRTIKGVVQRVDIVSMGSFLTYDMTHSRSVSEWTTLENTTAFRPYDWLTFEWKGNWNMIRDFWSTSNSDAIISFRNVYIVLGHRYSRKSNSTLNITVDLWLNPRWGVGGYWRHEFDKNQTQEFELRLTRDLHDWLLDFGYNMRRFSGNEDDDQDWEFFFEFTMKGFPEFPLKSGERYTFTRPRIGETVAGADQDFDIAKFRRGGYVSEEMQELEGL